MGTKKCHCDGKNITEKCTICSRDPKSVQSVSQISEPGAESNMEGLGLRPEKSGSQISLPGAESSMGDQGLRPRRSGSQLLGSRKRSKKGGHGLKPRKSGSQILGPKKGSTKEDQGLKPRKPGSKILGPRKGSTKAGHGLRPRKSGSQIFQSGRASNVESLEKEYIEVFASEHDVLSLGKGFDSHGDGSLEKKNSQYTGQADQIKCQICKNIPKCGPGLCEKQEIIKEEEIIEDEEVEVEVKEEELEKAASKAESKAESKAATASLVISEAKREAEDKGEGCLEWSKLRSLLVFTVGSFLTMRIVLVALELG